MLSVSNVAKSYPTPRGDLPILNGITMSLDRGDAVAIMGPSGSGKSTLLYILGVLDAPSSGTVTLDGQDPFRLNEREQAAFRNDRIGFVFQDHSLLPQCSVLENVLAPTLVARSSGRGAGEEARARELLTQVGLGDRLDHRPGELSGGEKQRAAVARALIRDPMLRAVRRADGQPRPRRPRTPSRRCCSISTPARKTILVVVTHNAALAERFPSATR